MIKPVRLLSLVVCAVIGASAAYLIATHQMDQRIHPELPAVQGIAWDVEPTPTTPAAPVSSAPSCREPFEQAASTDEIPPFEPRVAAESEHDLTAHDRSSGFADATVPMNEEELFYVPETQVATAANYVAADWNETPEDSGYGNGSHADGYVIHQEEAAQPVAEASFAAGPEAAVREFEPGEIETAEDRTAEEIDSYVVRNPRNAEPVLTLRLGRTESSLIVRADDVSRPSLAPRRFVRDETPQASLFIDVDDRDLVCTIDAQHVDLRDLLTLVGERAGIPIRSSRHVTGLVSAHIKEMRLEDAIQRIIMPLGFSVGVSDDALIVGLHDEVSGLDRRLNGYDVPRGQDNDTPSTVRLVSHHAAARSAVELASAPAAVASGVVTAAPSAEPVIEMGEMPMHAAPEAVPADSLVGSAASVAASPKDPQRLPSVNDKLAWRRAELLSNEETVFGVIAEHAQTMMRDGQYGRTVEMLSQLVSDHGQSAQLFSLLGEAYYHCGEHQAAEVSLNRSLELYRNDARTNYFMGCTLRALGNRRRGQHYLLQAHHLDPMYPPVVNAQALAPR